ncbi:MAG: aldehyde:ferredoxin oxidoreductase [Thermoprotei archaeon]|nr:MAG: aldehyde:ferredoxin oxidoreductase [Thermoprotei archaeon]
MKLFDPYLSRVLYIDLTRKRYWVENREDIFEEYMGGVGVATKLLQEELPRNADTLGAENVIVFAVGPFNGVYPIASKTVAMFKSPLTGNLGESHAGGRSSIAIRMAGYGAIVIKGASDIPIYLAIHGEKVHFKDARALWGVRSTYTIGRVLREREPGSGYRTIMRIGRAGEELVRFASVVVDSYRHFGRLGLGAVMGSKKLKAIVISGKRTIPIPNKPKYREIYNKIYKAAIESPAMKKYHDYGTPVNVLQLNALGALPTKNLMTTKFEGAEEISGEKLAETKLARRVACAHCVVACIHIAAIREEYPHEKFFYTVRYVSYDYEPIYANGSMLGISDSEGLIRVLEEIEVQGLDAMSTGVVLAWATEAYMRGLISKEDTLLDLKWGDWKNYIQAIRYIVKQPNEFYKTLALGVEEAAKKYGGLEFALSFGRNEMPGYHTGPGCHLGWLIGARHSHLDNAGYSLDQKLLSKGLPTPEEYIDSLMKEEAWRQVLTSLVICLFARGIYKPDIVAEALNATGYEYKVDDILNIGWKIYKNKYKLKLELGFDPLKLRIPRRVLEVPTPHGGISEEYMKRAITYFSQKIKKFLES